MVFGGSPPDLWNPDYPAKPANQQPVTGPMARFVGHHFG